MQCGPRTGGLEPVSGAGVGGDGGHGWESLAQGTLTTITPCACPRTRDSHPGTRVEKVPRALEFRTHWAPLWVLLPAPFSVTKSVVGYLVAPPIPHNNSWRPWRQRLLNFSRRGGPGTPFPWHQNTRVTARRSPEPLALVGHQCIPAVPLQTRPGISGSGNKTYQRPQPSSVSPIPKHVKTSGEGGRGRFDAFCGEGLKYRRWGTSMGGQDEYTIDASASCSPHCLSVSPGKGSSSDLGNLHLSAHL